MCTWISHILYILSQRRCWLSIWSQIWWYQHCPCNQHLRLIGREFFMYLILCFVNGIEVLRCPNVMCFLVSYCQLMASEMKKKWKEVATTFDVPTGLFSARQSCVHELWNWSWCSWLCTCCFSSWKILMLINIYKKAVLPQGNHAMPQVFFSVEVRQR